MRVLRTLIVCLAVGLAPQLALAQNTHVSEAAGTSAAPSAPSPQIGPEEQLYYFKDGCATIGPRFASAQFGENYQKQKWLGACRFGVADGPGFLEENGKYYRAVFHHGFRPLNQFGFGKYNFSYQDNFLPGKARFIIRSDKIPIRNSFDYKSIIEVNLLVDATLQETEHLFSTGSFRCPYKGIGGTVPILDRSFEAAARKLCERYNAGQNGSPNARYVADSRLDRDANGKGVASTADRPNPAFEQMVLCDYTSKQVNCQNAFEKALAPFRTQIDAVIANDLAARAGAAASVDARYAPYEAAEAARLRGIASRIAAQGLTYSAPFAPSVPIAAPIHRVKLRPHSRKARP